MRPGALLITAMIFGSLLGICISSELRAQAPAMASLPPPSARLGDWVSIEGQRLECSVAPDSIYCAEQGGFPRLAFMATLHGGAAGEGEFLLARIARPGARAEMLARQSRRH